MKKYIVAVVMLLGISGLAYAIIDFVAVFNSTGVPIPQCTINFDANALPSMNVTVNTATWRGNNWLCQGACVMPFGTHFYTGTSTLRIYPVDVNWQTWQGQVSADAADEGPWMAPHNIMATIDVSGHKDVNNEWGYGAGAWVFSGTVDYPDISTAGYTWTTYFVTGYWFQGSGGSLATLMYPPS